MKKIVCIIIGVLILWSCTACSQNSNDEQSATGAEGSHTEKEISNDTSESFVSENSLSDTPEGMGEQLYNSFGKFWTGTYYYIDMVMRVEPADQESSSDTAFVSEYNYKIAVDQDDELAMLNMTMPDGTTGHLIIKDGKCYKLDDKNKNYMVQDYPYSVKGFGELYTTDLYIGMMNHIMLEKQGKEDFKLSENENPVKLDFEKYKLTPDSESSDAVTEAYITYYFDNGKPYAQLLETDKGKTIFIFNEITDKRGSDNLFEIPGNYNEVSEES